jgi:hypothetical protein
MLRYRRNTVKSHCVLLVCILLSNICISQWEPKAPGLRKRSETASVVYNGKLYTFLGFRDSLLRTEPTVEVYDPLKDEWQLLQAIDSNKSVTHQGFVLVDDNVWHIGGRVGRNPGVLTHEVWIYNITGDYWFKGPNLIDPATKALLKWAGGGAALLDRTIHVFGGFAGTACVGDQNKYHLTINVDEWMADSVSTQWHNERSPMPIPRNHLSTVVMNGEIYALGGQFGHDCGGGADKQHSHVYNPVSNTWRELPLLPLPRSHAEGSTFPLDQKLYIVAGQAEGTNNRNSTNRVTVFDPSTKLWYDDSSLLLPSKYEGLSSKVINEDFIISHGGEGSSAAVRNTTYSRKITRERVFKLGFALDTFAISLRKGDSAHLKTLTYSTDSITSFTASTATSWLTLTDSTGNTGVNGRYVGYKINTAGLEIGKYYGYIYANGEEAFGADTFVVQLIIPPLRKISINNPSVWEGNTGTKTVPFTVTLDSTSSLTISAKYNTQHITTNNEDIVLQSGTVTFPPGVISQRISIVIKCDTIDEVNEKFNVTLFDPVNATLAVAVGTASLSDDDAVSAIRIWDTTTSETKLSAAFRVTLNKRSGKTVKVLFDTRNGTAVQPYDYTAIANGTVTFNPGETIKYIKVTVKTDNVTENAETFSVVLKSPSNATIARSTASCRIYNGSALSSSSLLSITQPGVLNVKVYPNPTNSLYTVVVARSEPVHYTVLDMQGRIIQTGRFVGTLRLGAGWKPGSYILQLQGGGLQKQIKLVRE